MNSLNQHIFLLLNADAQASAFSIWLGRSLAEWPVFIALLLVALAWYRQSDRKLFVQRAVVTTALAMGMALAIRCTYYNPRPFVLGLGRMLIEHDATTSFPSFHATFLFSLALPLLAQSGARSTGLAITLLGLGIAWARIFVGVHYPLDMAGAFVTAAIATVIACAVFKRPKAHR
jgi:undecaprenyl-diphosphatase